MIWTIRLLRAVAVVSCVSACTQTEFAPNHYEELQKDCDERVKCNGSSAEFGSGDAIQKCTTESGKKLNAASAAVQNEFLETVARCSPLVVCDYVSCAGSDPNSGYALAHQQQIMQDCTQSVACRISNGQMVSMNAVAECVSQSSNSLNFGTPPQQQAFEQKFTKCATQTGCAWVACQ